MIFGRLNRCFRVGYVVILAALLISTWNSAGYAAPQSESVLRDNCKDQRYDKLCEKRSTKDTGGGSVHILRGTFAKKRQVFSLRPETRARVQHSLPLPELPLDLALYYQNRYHISYSFGSRWNSLLDCRVYEYPLGTTTGRHALVVSPEGRNLAYYYDAQQGTYRHPAGLFAELIKNADGSYDWKHQNSTVYHFDPDGYLETITDRNSNTITLNYSTINVTEPSAARDYLDDFENNPHLNWINSDTEPGADPHGCRWGDTKFSVLNVEVTDDPAEVINGSYSVKASFLPDVSSTYNDVLESSAGMFKPLTTYRVSFKYKCIEAIENGYIRAGFWEEDDKWYYLSFSKKVDIRPATGEEGTAELTFTTKDLQHYRFIITIIMNSKPTAGEIIFDDLSVEEISSSAPSSKKVVTSITDFQGRDTVITYGANGLASSVVDPAGRQTQFSYSNHNDLVEIINPELNATRFSYDDTHNLIKSVDAEGSVGQIEYFRSLDSVIKVISPDGGEHVFERDFGPSLKSMKASYIDPMLNREESTFSIPYNDNTYAEVIIKKVFADGSVGEWDWTPDRRESHAKFTDGITGQITEKDYDHDSLGRIVCSVDEMGMEVLYTYHPDFPDRVTSIEDPSGTVSRGYDGRGNMISVTDQLGFAKTYSSDPRGNRISFADENGNETLYEYNGLGQLERVIDAGGEVLSYTHDAANNKVSQTDPLGNTTLYAYNNTGQMTRITHSDESFEDFSYDKLDNRTSSTNENSAVSSFEYDSMSRLIGTTDPEGGQVVYGYDLNGNRTKVTDALGYKTLNTYNSRNYLISVKDPENNLTEYARDGMSRVLSRTDASGTVQYEYNLRGEILREVYQDGMEKGYERDILGRIVSTTDELGNITSYTYSKRGELIDITTPIGARTTRAFDSVGNLISVIDANDKEALFEYDGLNRLAKVTNALGRETRYEYDANGNRVKIVDPAGDETLFEFNNRNRLVKTVDLEGGEVSLVYDAAGNLLARTDAEGGTTTYTYNGKNERLSETDALENTTLFLYNLRSDLISITDANANTTVYCYNGNSQLKEELFSDGGKKVYAYGDVGNLFRTVDQNGTEVLYAYDNRNRLVRRDIVPGTGVVGTTLQTFEYDTAGRLIRATDDNDPADSGDDSVATFVYDSASRVIGTTQNGRTVSFNYDLVGNETSIIYPSGKVVTMDYTELNSLDVVRVNGLAVADYDYSPKNLPSSI